MTMTKRVSSWPSECPSFNTYQLVRLKSGSTIFRAKVSSFFNSSKPAVLHSLPQSLTQQKVIEVGCNTYKSLYKAIVIVSKTKKLLYPLNAMSCNPINHSQDLVKGYCYLTQSHLRFKLIGMRMLII